MDTYNLYYVLLIIFNNWYGQDIYVCIFKSIAIGNIKLLFWIKFSYLSSNFTPKINLFLLVIK